MAGEPDDTGRFDYLFEPLEADVANTEGTVAPAGTADTRSRTAATRLGIAAVVVAMIAVAIATVIFLLQRSDPASRVDAPIRPSTPPSVEPIATIEPIFQAPPQVTASSLEPPLTTAVVVPQPQPAPQPAPTSAPRTAANVTETKPPSPTIRAPISVEPEPHPPFPNQNAPSGDDDQGGGLLGGLF